MSNILIIKHGSLGDLIQANGAIKDIKNFYRNRKVFLLTAQPYAIFMSECPYLDGVIIDKRLPRWNLFYLKNLKKNLTKYFNKHRNPYECPNELYVAATRARDHLILLHHYQNDFLPFINREQLQHTTRMTYHYKLYIRDSKKEKNRENCR
mgnify:CR=1 FL=1